MIKDEDDEIERINGIHTQEPRCNMRIVLTRIVGNLTIVCAFDAYPFRIRLLKIGGGVVACVPSGNRPQPNNNNKRNESERRANIAAMVKVFTYSVQIIRKVLPTKFHTQKRRRKNPSKKVHNNE